MEETFSCVFITAHAISRLRERWDSEKDGNFPENLESFFENIIKVAHRVGKPENIKENYPWEKDKSGRCFYYKSFRGPWYFISKRKKRNLIILSVFKRDEVPFGLKMERKYRFRNRGRRGLRRKKIYIKGRKGVRLFPDFEEIIMPETIKF